MYYMYMLQIYKLTTPGLTFPRGQTSYTLKKTVKRCIVFTKGGKNEETVKNVVVV